MPLRRRALLGGLPLLPLAPALALRPREALAGKFEPPGPEARAAALGPLDDLSPTLRAALRPELERARALVVARLREVQGGRESGEPVDDLPIPRPGPDDWLAQQRERGQTHAQYLRGGFNRPDERRRTIVVMPIGELDEGMPAIADLVDFVGRYFQLPARAAPTLAVDQLTDLGVRSRSRRGGRRQYLSGDILARLKWRLPSDAYCLIAVTAVDLYPDAKWNFVFGEALLHERVGVHSFARYDPAFYGQRGAADRPRTILGRGLKVMAHEIGHMFSMLHCVHYHCLMNGTNHLAETDRAPLHLCPVCRRKLHSAVAYDPAKREAELAELCQRHGLSGPAERYARRAATIAEVAAAVAAVNELGLRPLRRSLP